MIIIIKPSKSFASIYNYHYKYHSIHIYYQHHQFHTHIIHLIFITVSINYIFYYVLGMFSLMQTLNSVEVRGKNYKTWFILRAENVSGNILPRKQQLTLKET